ncbi:MAG: glycerophosphodiester phosphodiesterase [Bacteroidetes bacterium]|nr:glycerophosphodiester phosphodiesterase [Rhodothermia bacterium]MCS7155056.1 glycerophosphodiester phosphodiesterase [Bacteroidota bacterium]MCX7907340.1 glycerophosphodiester phosphodiesterase [Bacteroidota bacterium]MDW8137933.1 glycerophosphodiester phosphodiesterase [Bacteroidota bacterium]MDW8286215.1 glycerophosphodiester phosphodiesterase [Bacteroidota bacterium]
MPRWARNIAHRGASGHAPENTLVAFARALELGADGLELDVRLCADGRLVVLHDATLERTTDGRGPVRAYPYAQLRRLDAGYRFSPDGGRTFPFRDRGVRIPLLEEVLEAFPEVPLTIELKESRPEAVEALVRLLRGRADQDRLLVGSFYTRQLRRFRALMPQVATSAGYREVLWLRLKLGRPPWPFALVQIPPRYPPEGLGLIRLDSSAWIGWLKAQGLGVQYWTVDDPDAMRRLLRAGADGIITGYPDRFPEDLGGPG